MKNNITNTNDASKFKVSHETPAADYNKANIITLDETEKLVKSLIEEAQHETWAVCGLMFLFDSFFNALCDGGRDGRIDVQNICEEIRRTIYPYTWNADDGLDYTVKNLASAYRKADFHYTIPQNVSAQHFLDAETEARRKEETNKMETAEPLENTDTRRQTAKQTDESAEPEKSEDAAELGSAEPSYSEQLENIPRKFR